MVEKEKRLLLKNKYVFYQIKYIKILKIIYKHIYFKKKIHIILYLVPAKLVEEKRNQIEDY